MPTIGNRTINVDTIDRDEVVYSGPTNTVSHTDQVLVRRTRAKGKPLRTNLRFNRGFPSQIAGEPEREVVISISMIVPPNVVTADVGSFVSDTLTQAVSTAGNLAITGDINL